MPRATLRPTLDEFVSLDIRWLARERVLANGGGCITTTRGGTPIATTRIVVIEAGPTVELRYWTSSGDPTSERVDLTSTAQHFGGSRVWWLCPGCARRAAVLYGRPYRCRRCWGAAYPSQRETKTFRTLRRLQRWRDQMGADANTLEALPVIKPKWMRWATWSRLYQRSAEAEGQYWEAVSRWLDARRAARIS